MQTADTAAVKSVRSFNRFYTNILGLLNKHLLSSDYSLSEVRVLYEVAHTEDCTMKLLCRVLTIDVGYLSRIVKRFESEELLQKLHPPGDRRLYYLTLTGKGLNLLDELDSLSSRQIKHMLTLVSPDKRKKVVRSMKYLEDTLSGTGGEEKITFRTELKPGDAGYLIYLHGWIYDKECGYDHTFEGYVCKTFYNFLENYDPNKDRMWLAESDGEIIGSLAVVGRTPERAQLRWFILHPDFRGRGLGRRLFGEALAYCREKGYQTVFLETTDDQKTAIRMYTGHGFQLVKEHELELWGKHHTEQTYELHM